MEPLCAINLRAAAAAIQDKRLKIQGFVSTTDELIWPALEAGQFANFNAARGLDR
jgi:hypothetical protein